VTSDRVLLMRARRIDLPTVDVLVAVLFGAIVVGQEVAATHPDVISLFAGLVVCATVAWRRRAPRVAVLVTAVGVGVAQPWGGSVNLAPPEFAIVLNFYMLGRCSVERERRAADVLFVVIALPAVAVVPGNSRVGDFVPVWALFVALPFLSGWVVGKRVGVSEELLASTRRLDREQRDRTQRALSEERARIARELHDVVAHSISVMVIQTQAARRMAGHNREAAHEALRSVERCGRDALSEMRRMVGVLHRGELELAGVESRPGLAELRTLVERARASGLPIELEIEGEPRPLPATVELVVFRLVQEALTNAIKHAGPARAVVRVTFTATAIEAEVTDTGRGSVPPPGTGGGGHGLVGMRERVARCGGELTTGSPGGGGFRVRAWIPLVGAVRV
jgi:signal transduction histidine kinase